MVVGMYEGYEKKFQLVGVGYCVVVKGKVLDLIFGFLYLVNFEVLEGIMIEILS